MLTDRHKHVLQFLTRFGSTRREDIFMFKDGGSPSASEIKVLRDRGFIKHCGFIDQYVVTRKGAKAAKEVCHVR